MPQKPTPTETPEPTPEPTEAPTEAPAPTPEPTPTPTPEKTFTQAQLDAQKKAWEKEWNKKVTDAEARAKLTEDERLKAERDDAVNNLRERDTRDAVIESAAAAGVKNAKLFYNAYKNELEFDDKTGKVTNLKEVLESAKSESPELFGSPAPAPAGGADGGDGKIPPTALTKEKIAAMTDREIADNMDAIDKFFASGK